MSPQVYTLGGQVVLSGGGAVAAGVDDATLIFSYPSGFAGASSNFSVGPDAADITAGVIRVTNGAVGMHEAGHAWWNNQVNIQSFTTTFTFQPPSGLTIPSITGMAFEIQNSTVTTNPGQYGLNANGDANMLGFGGYSNQGPSGSQTITWNSVAVKFDLQAQNTSGANAILNYPTGGSPSGTGVYINGGPYAVEVAENDLNPYGINLYSGHVFACTLVYDGTLLTMVLLDTTTNAQARYVWPVNIPGAAQQNTAYVGFVGGTIPAVVQGILSWTWWQGYNTRLATPTFSVTPGSYTSTQSVSLSAPAGSTIYYTTNGLLPTSASTLYTGPITVSSSQIINAVAIQSGYTDSLVATGNYQITSSANVINLPSGFSGASGLIILTGYSSFSGSAIKFTDEANLETPEVGAAWYAAPVNIQTFSTSFTLECTGGGNGGSYGVGMTFCIQNQPSTSISNAASSLVSGGPTALGNANDALGYGYFDGTLSGTTGGLLSSVAIKFDLSQVASSNGAVGLYIDGAVPTSAGEVAITGLNLASGHPITVALTYNGTTLSMLMTDTVTSGTFSYSWTINIPSTVGANTAYVGFTASTGYFYANQTLQAWTFLQG